MRRTTVAGQPIEVLRAALAKLQHTTTSDGMMEISGELDPELGEPLWRAVLRIEKELLEQDMEVGDVEGRTSEQRRADAFVLLVTRCTSAQGRS